MIKFYSIKNQTHFLLMRKLKIETYEAIKILDENVEREWNEMRKFENKIIFLIIIIFRNVFIITLSFFNQTQQTKH